MDASRDSAEDEDDARAGRADAGFVSCESDKDCKDLGLLCDPLIERCVQCVFDPDCGEEAHCEENSCVPFTSCVNSLDCVDDPRNRSICDQEIGECVECLSGDDCPKNQTNGGN